MVSKFVCFFSCSCAFSRNRLSFRPFHSHIQCGLFYSGSPRWKSAAKPDVCQNPEKNVFHATSLPICTWITRIMARNKHWCTAKVPSIPKFFWKMFTKYKPGRRVLTLPWRHVFALFLGISISLCYHELGKVDGQCPHKTSKTVPTLGIGGEKKKLMHMGLYKFVRPLFWQVLTTVSAPHCCVNPRAPPRTSNLCIERISWLDIPTCLPSFPTISIEQVDSKQNFFDPNFVHASSGCATLMSTCSYIQVTAMVSPQFHV